MKVDIHLHFNGNCEEAFKFYSQLMHGRIESMFRYGDSPAATRMPPGYQDKLVHATLTLGAQHIAGADVADGYCKPQGFQLIVQLDDLEKGQQVFDQLAKGGEVEMAFQKTFWSPGYGIVRDRFGVPWEVNVAGATA